MAKFLLEIVTPYQKYLSKEVDFLRVSSSSGQLGITPNHSPLISDVLISEVVIKCDGKVKGYATSGGIINIKKDKVTLLLNSIESKEEIDITRANEAKKRAEALIEKSKVDSDIDLKRAELALQRAINRIQIYSK